MNSSSYVKGTMAVLAAAIIVISIIVPVVYGASTSTVTRTNEGGGWVKFAYNDETVDYNISMSSNGSTLTLGAQSGAADEMIVYASDVFSILYADSSFKLVAPSGVSADLGSSAAVISSSGTVTVTDSERSTAYSTDAVTWSYVPDTDGSFRYFTDTGKVVKDYPAAAAGAFAGAYAYDDLNSLGISTLAPTYSVSDGVFNQGDWEIQSNVLHASYNSPIAPPVSTQLSEIRTNAIVDPLSGTLIGDLYYTLSDTSATVVGISSTLSSATSITIPDTVEHDGITYTVAAIADGSGSDGVFANMTALESVTFSANLTTIGNNAFNRCTSLALTSLPDSVTSIGNGAFYGCTSLALTSLPDSLTTIGSYAFNRCTSLALTSLPDSLTTIGNNAFNGCTSLALTSLPDSLTTIGNGAFYGCTSLALTSLPDSLTTIGSYAFNGCTSLETLTIPIATTSISSAAFNACTNLTLSLDITANYNDQSVIVSWDTGLDASGNPTYVVTAADTVDGYGVASWTYDSTDYAVGDSVTMALDNRNITATVLSGIGGQCGDSLTFNLDLTNGTLTISGEGVMYEYSSSSAAPWNVYKDSIVDLIIDDGATSIGNYAFFRCANLVHASLPNSVTVIGDNAFFRCSSLALTSLPDSVTSIGTGAFNACTSLALTSLPDSLTSIGSGTFQNCTNLALTSLPDSLTSIGSVAFNRCGSLALTSLPDSLTSIGNNAFQGCSSLANLVIGGSPYIGSNAFLDCSNLASVVITGSPTLGSHPFTSSIGEILNLGDTEITAGSYGLSADCEVDDAIRAIGYVAPATYTETVQNTGLVYTVMSYIPVLIIVGLMFGVLGVIVSNRRA